MKKLSALFISLVLVLNTAFTDVYAQEAPIAPSAPDAPVAPSAPTPPPVPENPYAQPTPTPEPVQTTAPATVAPDATEKPAKTPHPKAATPKPAATAQGAATAQPAATPIPSVTAPADQPTDITQPTSAIAGQPAYGQSTGGQIDNSNQGNHTVSTGDVNLNAGVVNDVNSNLLGNGGNGINNGGTNASNNQNGSNSNNNSQTNQNTTSDAALSNVADIGNSIALGASTGSNSSSRNTGDGTVLTGDANVGVTVINGGNNNVQGLAVNQYDIANNQSGDIILGSSNATASCGTVTICQSGVLGAQSSSNTGNGSDSSNQSTNNAAALSDVSQTNNAEVSNSVAIDAVTGRNKADSNVGSGTIETGDANIAVTILNFLNNNIVAGAVDVVNIFGDYAGDILIPKSNNVAGNNASGNNAAGNHVSNNSNAESSSNNAASNSTLSKNIDQTNAADISNNVSIDANTGENRAASNTGGDNNIETGEVNANAQIYNLSNINSTDGGYIVLINDKGTWRGKVMGADGSEQMQFDVQPDGSVVATNQGNGSNSENNATTATASNQNVSQTNQASVSNNVNISADTGNNSASRNTNGGGEIKTGDVNVGVSIMNFVNNNFVGQTFRVLLVNVFGNWTGAVKKEGEVSNHTAPSDSQTPAVGGIQHADSSSQVASNTTLSEDQPSTTPAESVSTYISSGSVLGAVSPRQGGRGFEVKLADGRTYYTDDTLTLPESKPLVAAMVEKHSTNHDQWFLLAPLAILFSFGVLKYKKHMHFRINN